MRTVIICVEPTKCKRVIIVWCEGAGRDKHATYLAITIVI